MKISKVIFHIKLIPTHLWWECKNCPVDEIGIYNLPNEASYELQLTHANLSTLPISPHDSFQIGYFFNQTEYFNQISKNNYLMIIKSNEVENVWLNIIIEMFEDFIDFLWNLNFFYRYF